MRAANQHTTLSSLSLSLLSSFIRKRENSLHLSLFPTLLNSHSSSYPLLFSHFTQISLRSFSSSSLSLQSLYVHGCKKPLLPIRYLTEEVKLALSSFEKKLESEGRTSALSSKKKEENGDSKGEREYERGKDVELLVHWKSHQTRKDLIHHLQCFAASRYASRYGVSPQVLAEWIAGHLTAKSKGHTHIRTERECSHLLPPSTDLGITHLTTDKKGFVFFQMSDEWLTSALRLHLSPVLPPNLGLSFSLTLSLSSFSLSSLSHSLLQWRLPVYRISGYQKTSKDVSWSTTRLPTRQRKCTRGICGALSSESLSEGFYPHADMMSKVSGVTHLDWISLSFILTLLISHIGDFGTPIGLVLGEILVRSLSLSSLSSLSLSDLYVSAKERAAKDPSFHDFGKAVCTLYQQHLLSLPLPESVSYGGRAFESSVWVCVRKRERREWERERIWGERERDERN